MKKHLLFFCFFTRKLTSSQITISTKTYSYKTKNEAHSYAETALNIYNTDLPAAPELLYDNLENVRKQASTLDEENIYGQTNTQLYSTWGQCVYGTQDHVVYPTRDQVVGPTEEHVAPHDQTFNPVQGSNGHDPLYQCDISRVPEDPYGINPSLYVDNTHDIHVLRDQASRTQAQSDPAKENIFIHECYSG